jgi:hypothetical protein
VALRAACGRHTHPNRLSAKIAEPVISPISR